MASSSSAIVTNSSTTFPSSSGRQFDVLLSFGKGDEGSGIFAEQLSEALHERDIRVFVDTETPAGGDDGVYEVNLSGVIEGSSVCVPILCSNYAYSRQCLWELSECVAGKKIILPVFYGVDPSDVRRQKGPFEPAFREHNLRLDVRTVERWRDALGEVGDIVGYVVADIHADGAWSGIVKLWSVPQVKKVATLKHHTERATDVAFSTLNNLLATASADKTAVLWNSEGSLLRMFQGHLDRFARVSFHPLESS